MDRQHVRAFYLVAYQPCFDCTRWVWIGPVSNGTNDRGGRRRRWNRRRDHLVGRHGGVYYVERSLERCHDCNVDIRSHQQRQHGH